MVFDGPSRNLYKTSLADGDEIQKEADNARHLGYDGKMVIHPSQLRIINKTFSPTKEEIAKAQKIVAAFTHSNGAAVCVDGQMTEALHYRQALETLAIQDAINSWGGSRSAA